MPKIPLTGGVWSATPTPLTAAGRVDVPAVERLVDHHVRMGVTGLMLAGTGGADGLGYRADLLEPAATP